MKSGPVTALRWPKPPTTSNGLAVGVRRFRGGQVTRLPTTGAVAGAFVHRTSRALDPHLHTHLVVANVAQGVDGVWSAVDSRRVFAHHRAVRGIYHARLRTGAGTRLGAAWEVPASGMGDVRGRRPRRCGCSSRSVSAAIAEYTARRSAGRGVRADPRGVLLPPVRTRTAPGPSNRWSGSGGTGQPTSGSTWAI